MGRKRTTDKSILENRIWNTWYETKKGKEIYTIEQARVLAAVGLVLERLESEDVDKGSVHVKEFVLSYLKEDFISAKNISATTIYLRVGIEIVRNGKGRFFKIENLAEESIVVKLIKSRKARNRWEIAADLLIPLPKLQKDTNWYIRLFDRYYKELKYIPNNTKI